MRHSFDEEQPRDPRGAAPEVPRARDYKQSPDYREPEQWPRDPRGARSERNVGGRSSVERNNRDSDEGPPVRNMKWRDRGPMRGGSKARRGGGSPPPENRKYYGANVKDLKANAVPQKDLPEILMFDKEPTPVEKNFTIDR